MLAAISLIRQWWPLVGMLAAFAAGWTVQGWRHEAREADLLQARFEAWQAKQEQGNKLSAELEEALAAIRENTRSLARRLDRETQNDSYRCPVPGDGVQLLREAVTGDPARQPDRPVP